MYGKIVITSTLKVVTGLHIGGSGSYSAIGAVDSPVITDPITNQPIIPGSSLKGKMRTLLNRIEKDSRHDPSKDSEIILRLFGSASPVKTARLQFADAFVSNAGRFSEIGLTEIKMENNIDRITSVANPRQIERVNKGVEFAVRMVYDMEDLSEAREDMEYVAKAMKLLQLDYLGGHGTRGSGRVSFHDIRITPYFFDGEPDLSDIQKLFSDIEDYQLV